MELADWIAAKRASPPRFAPAQTRDVTPALRDFTRAVTTHRGALSVTVELAPGDSASMGARVTACDEANVSAAAIAIDSAALGGTEANLVEASRADRLPLLARDLFLSPEMLYRARLLGADAVWLHAGALPAFELKRLVEIAASMHVASAIEARSTEELAAALGSGARIVVLEWPASAALLDQVPRTVALLLRGEFPDRASLEAVRGLADGVWLGAPETNAEALGARLAPLVEAAENG